MYVVTYYASGCFLEKGNNGGTWLCRSELLYDLFDEESWRKCASQVVLPAYKKKLVFQCHS